MRQLALVLAITICVIRLFIEPHPASWQGTYQALAHVLVGTFLGAWLTGGGRIYPPRKGDQMYYFWLASLTIVVEVSMAIFSRIL